MSEGLIWEKVVWRQGDGRYVFEIDRGGLHATLTPPHGRGLTLPTIAWYGLLDALAAARRTHARADRPAAPRHGERWGQVESEELAASFRQGMSADALARRHNRSRGAVEAQLARLDLCDRETDTQAHHESWRGSGGPPTPEPPWPEAYPPAAPDPPTPRIAARVGAAPAGEAARSDPAHTETVRRQPATATPLET